MMKFEWRAAQSWDAEHNYITPGVWNLYLLSDTHFDQSGHPYATKRIGTLFKLRRAWRIAPRWNYSNDKPDEYWLDADLTLDEAQRAAKLILCVGRQT